MKYTRVTQIMSNGPVTALESVALLHVVLDLDMTIKVTLLSGTVRAVWTRKWLLPGVCS